MIRRIDWLPPARDDLRALDWKLAAKVAATVKLLALSGIGDVVQWTNPGRPDEWRLYVPDTRYYARIRVAPSVVYVERVLLSP
jgi:hypothetical protein